MMDASTCPNQSHTLALILEALAATEDMADGRRYGLRIRSARDRHSRSERVAGGAGRSCSLGRGYHGGPDWRGLGAASSTRWSEAGRRVQPTRCSWGLSSSSGARVWWLSV